VRRAMSMSCKRRVKLGRLALIISTGLPGKDAQNAHLRIPGQT
jgi:hypothetical protein